MSVQVVIMDVYWFEQTESDVPSENDWLSASEATRLNEFRFAKRRSEWRLGRWTAKRALATYLALPLHPRALADIEIRPVPEGAPEAFVANQPASVTISLSHRDGLAVCAICMGRTALGCDLETVEPHSDAFVADCFTAEEQACIAQASATDRPQVISLLWSAKESALKALRKGLRLDTRSVIATAVDLPALRTTGEERPTRDQRDTTVETWRPLQVSCTSGEIFQGWWRQTNSILRTLAAAPPPLPPILLKAA